MNNDGVARVRGECCECVVKVRVNAVCVVLSCAKQEEQERGEEDKRRRPNRRTCEKLRRRLSHLLPFLSTILALSSTFSRSPLSDRRLQPNAVQDQTD